MLSQTFQDLILNILRSQNVTAPESLKIHLYTGTVGSGPEVSDDGTAYVAKAVTYGAPATDGETGNRQIKNSAAVTFDKATASWGTITHFKVQDGATIYATAELVSPKPIDVDDIAQFDENTIVVVLGDLPEPE
jgi:hypothetical protein